VFLAVPMAVDLKMREPVMRSHANRVQAKRRAEGLVVDADGDPIARVAVDAENPDVAPVRRSMPGVQAAPASPLLKPGSGPLPGVKPVRPAGKSKGTAPQGKSARGVAPKPAGKRSR